MNAALPVEPWPREIESSGGVFSFASLRTGADSPLTLAPVTRFAQQVARRFGDRVAIQPGAPAANVRFSNARENGAGSESYEIDISPNEIAIRATSAAGFAYALETLFQLMEGGADSLTIPCLRIRDAPRFPWRGLLLDPVRHWLPVDVIKQTLDGMAAVKLNVLHWHLSDDQAFRIECESYPRLHTVASRGDFYAVRDVAEVIEYASALAIRVVPEFDLPGHATSWVVAYPHLGCTDQPPQLQDRWGIFDTLLNPARQTTYEFLETFIAEMASRFPDECLHIGGDEVNGREWLQSTEVAEHMRSSGVETAAELQAQFMERVGGIVRKYGKRPVVWEEGASAAAVTQTYRSAEAAALPRPRGGQVIVSHGFYLDLMQPAAEHYAVILPDPDDSGGGVIGGEACLWSEFVDGTNIASRLWPRLAAIAERLWSQPGGEHETSINVRLHCVQNRLLALGIDPRADLAVVLRQVSPDLAEPLAFISGAFEPVKDYVRHLSGRYDVGTPLNRLVDVIPPESRMTGEMDSMVSRGELRALVRLLERLISAATVVETGLERGPLSGLVPDVKRLRLVASIGIDVIQAMLGGKGIAEETEKELGILTEAIGPANELQVPLAATIQRLIRCVDTRG
jgi:hexosaminidase